VSVRQLYDGLDRPDSNSLQRRRSQGRSSDSALTPSTASVAEPSATPRRLQSLLIRGGGAPDVHVPLIAGGAMVQPRPLRRSEGQPPSEWGRMLPL
jgi:hypothetical protein